MKMTSERYSRQTLFKGIGHEGQQKISQKHVLIVGMGGLEPMLLRVSFVRESKHFQL